MATSLQDLSFGDFSGLSEEEQEHVLNILHGPKGPADRKVEFPWDGLTAEPVQFMDTGIPVAAAGYSGQQWIPIPVYAPPTVFAQAQVLPPPGLAIHGGMQYAMHDMQFGYSHSEPMPNDMGMAAQTGAPMGYPQGGDVNEPIMDDNNQRNDEPAQVSRLQASLKPYERRNKKKRPRDYYNSDGGRDNSANFNQQNSGSDSDARVSEPKDTVNSHEAGQGATPDMKYRSEMHFSLASQNQMPHLHQTEVNTNYMVTNQGMVEGAIVQSPSGQILPPHPVQYPHPMSQPPPQPQPMSIVYPISPGKGVGEELREVVVEQVPPHLIASNMTPQIPYQNRTSSVQTQEPQIGFVQPEAGMYPSPEGQGLVFTGGAPSGQPQFETGHAQEVNSDQFQNVKVVDSIQVQSSVCSSQVENVNSVDSRQEELATTPSFPVESSNLPSVSANTEVTSIPSASSGPGLTNVASPVSVPESSAGPTAPIPQSAQSESDTQGPKTTPADSTIKVVTTQEPPKPKSWAGLFKSASSAPNYAQPTTVVKESPVNSSKKEPERSDREFSPLPVPATEDSEARHLGDLLSKLTISHASVALQPRGLINRANWCYINGTLQALVACPPFYNLLKRLPRYPALSRGPSSTPILDAIVQFVNEFELMPRTNDRGPKNRNKDIVPGPAFEPSYVYKMLQVIAVNPHFKLGKQEDAEEFLSCILDGMHEEMLSSVRLITGDKSEEGKEEGVTNGYIHAGDADDQEEEMVADDDWEQVGPKKRSVLTRRANFSKSPIADIFAGMVRSAVYKATSKETATLEPFFTLQLDIQSEKVWSVKDALDGLVSKEAISGYTCSSTNEEVEIVRKQSLEELPPVLILHLKFFVYDKDGGCQKAMKKVDYPVELEITKDLLSPNAKNKLGHQQRCYKLFAVVYHHGKTSTGGHYTTSVFHPGINGWVTSDDSQIKTVPVSQVLKFIPPRVPYLLYYRRLDSSN